MYLLISQATLNSAGFSKTVFRPDGDTFKNVVSLRIDFTYASGELGVKDLCITVCDPKISNVACIFMFSIPKNYSDSPFYPSNEETH